MDIIPAKIPITTTQTMVIIIQSLKFLLNCTLNVQQRRLTTRWDLMDLSISTYSNCLLYTFISEEMLVCPVMCNIIIKYFHLCFFSSFRYLPPPPSTNPFLPKNTQVNPAQGFTYQPMYHAMQFYDPNEMQWSNR